MASDDDLEPKTRCGRCQRLGARAFWYSMGTSPENEGSCRIVIMGWGFLFIFMAFNTTQTILSTVLQHYVGSVSHVEYDLGMASLMIMYVTTCPSLYAIPAVIRSLGAVVTMMLGGLCYAVYIISLIYIWEPTVILSSAVVGFGQAAIWVQVRSIAAEGPRERAHRDHRVDHRAHACTGEVCGASVVQLGVTGGEAWVRQPRHGERGGPWRGGFCHCS